MTVDSPHIPPGFGLRKSCGFSRSSILLPLDVVDAINQETEARIADPAERSDEGPPPPFQDRAPRDPPPSSGGRDALWISQTMDALRRVPRDAAVKSQPLFTIDAFQRALERTAAHAAREQRARDQAVLEQIARRGQFRAARFPDDAGAALTALIDAMPHFAEVTRLVLDRTALGRAAARAGVGVPPVLLVGPPGVGKSHYAAALAEALRTSVHRIAMDSVQTASTLSGSDSYWANARPGTVFTALAESDTLFPVIVLDEIDKAPTEGQHNPLAPLHGLLEPVTARRFSDRCLELEMDASGVVWIATANNLDAIDAPLLSRFAVHHIRAPSLEDSRGIARNVARQLLAELGIALEIAPAVYDALALRSPREQRQSLESAVARAVRLGKPVLDPACLPPARADARTRRGMGFLAPL